MQKESVFAKGAIERIFDGDIVPNVKKNGEIEHIRIRGFHYEDADVMLARGIEIIEESRTAPDTRGVYRAAIMVRGYLQSSGNITEQMVEEYLEHHRQPSNNDTDTFMLG